jgi:hypothetical protein
MSSRTLKIFFSAAFLGKGRFFIESAPHAMFSKTIIPAPRLGSNAITAMARAIPETIIVKVFNTFTFSVLIGI